MATWIDPKGERMSMSDEDALQWKRKDKIVFAAVIIAFLSDLISPPALALMFIVGLIGVGIWYLCGKTTPIVYSLFFADNSSANKKCLIRSKDEARPNTNKDNLLLASRHCLLPTFIAFSLITYSLTIPGYKYSEIFENPFLVFILHNVTDDGEP